LPTSRPPEFASVPLCRQFASRYAAAMHASRQVILLTGFGPFPGVPTNASAELVPRLAEVAARRLTGYRVVSEILPTEWAAGPQCLLDILREHKPALAVHFGVSSRADGFAVEMRGHNACSSLADAAGLTPASRCIVPEGPDVLPATLPVHYIVRQLRQRGFPAGLSRDAGGYLCNSLLYHSLEFGRRHLAGSRAGFIHIPDGLVARGLRGARRSRPGCRLNLDQAVEGGLDIVSLSLGRPSLPLRR